MKSHVVDVEVARGRTLAGDHLVVGLWSDAEPDFSPLGARAAQAARELAAAQRGRWEEGRLAATPLPAGRALTLAGLGKRSEWSEERRRAFCDRAVDVARSARAKHLGVVLPETETLATEAAAERVARHFALAGYRFATYLSTPPSGALDAVTLAVPASWRRAYAAGIATAMAVAHGTVLSRELGNTPPNQASPIWMARQAERLAKSWGADVRVLGPAEMKRRGMGGILAVGGGSTTGPRMVRIELGRSGPAIALVGKGITFDTGGISIKPAAQMEEMKWDKMGACGVLGILEAASRLDLPLRLRAYLPFAENMPDGSAYRPGDIVRCANGKTVEITNTDAEGRMVLADALHWAASERPDALVEYSTLTGACVVALGHTGAGLFTPSDRLSSELLAAADGAGERLWRLPLWPEFLEEMRGTHSDLRNSGGRWGGASTAAAFLSQFVAPVDEWAHLDIAGPAYVGSDPRRRGATGYGVALTIGWLRSRAARGAAPARKRRRR